MHHVVVFGGAGFIGREVCMAFAEAGWEVTAADGLMRGTTCDAARAQAIHGVRLVECVTDAEPELVARLAGGADVIVDAMGWTRHLDALADPLWDLRLNVASHLPLVQAWSRLGGGRPRVLFLGSSHQYGKSLGGWMSEDAKAEPHDVQGIHKLAAEHHWRIAATGAAQAVVSLRFGNTFGPGMSVDDGDVGLIGGFFRAALRGGAIEVFGTGRRRNVIYSRDVARLVCLLAQRELAGGFHPFNVSGHDVEVGELAQSVVRAVGQGTVIETPMPAPIQRVEIGQARLSNAKLVSVLGEVPSTGLDAALAETAASLSLVPPS